jgi:hypothetical protein
MSDNRIRKATAFFAKLFTALAINEVTFNSGVAVDQYVLHCTAKTSSLVGNKVKTYVQNSIKPNMLQPVRITLESINLITDSKMIIILTTQANAELG